MIPDEMSVSDAVARRISARSYLTIPVKKSIIIDILERARRTPSGGNLQPWRVDVLTGRDLEQFKAIVQTRAASGVQETPRYEVYPANLWEPHRTYRYKVGEDMYASLGLERSDKQGRLQRLFANFRFFDAPVGLFFSMHQGMGVGQWSDLGMLMQTVMLLAVERGLATCAQESWGQWPDTVAEYLDLGPTQILFAGMALGYPDLDAPVNRFGTDRAQIDAFVRLRGFED